MVDGSEGVTEVNVYKVDIFGGESSIFEGSNDHLDLLGCVPLWSEAFLAKV